MSEVRPDAQPPSGRDPVTTSRGPLAGLNPMGLMNAALFEDSQEWQPPQPESLEALMEGYEDFSFIDRGGMGAVYAATQKSLSRRVAIKVLPPELGDDANFVRLFEREGQMLGQLQHPHIVTVYESGRTRAGHLFLVMEYVHGVTLQEKMRSAPPTPTKALDYVAQVCDALSYAHGRGVIHLDIKPANILIDERDLVRVADFGLSKSLLSLDNETTSRRTQGFLGTVGYAAPEQRRKNTPLDHRADLYSLGVTLYEMLTGHLPVGVFDPPSKKAGTPGHVDRLIMRAMRETPEDRFQSARELRSAIATSMLRMGTPLVQRAIISRPMVAMATSIMVGMGFIYLLDGLSRQLNATSSRPLTTLTASEPDGAKLVPALTPLDEQWAVIRQSVRWSQIPALVAEFPGWQQAEIHSEAEQQQVAKLLREHEITRPLWLGAQFIPDKAGGHFVWRSGKPMTFQAWMPARSQPPLLITEIQAKNGSSLRTPDGQTPDWIEVHNASSEPVDLSGYHLRHFFGGRSLGEYVVQGWVGGSSGAAGGATRLQPGEYRVIGCSPRLGKSSGLLHFDFSLEGSSGRLEWFDPQGLVCQRFEQNWTAFPEDGSIGVTPDGKEWGWCQKPTPGAANAPVTAPFPAPSTTSPTRAGLVLMPEFEARWSRSPIGISNAILLRRSVPASAADAETTPRSSQARP